MLTEIFDFRHEGRTWYSSHRGRLWIASTAKPVNVDEVIQMEQFYKNHYNDEKIEFPSQYPAGCLLGCVSVQVSSIAQGYLTS